MVSGITPALFTVNSDNDCWAGLRRSSDFNSLKSSPACKGRTPFDIWGSFAGLLHHNVSQCLLDSLEVSAGIKERCSCR